MRLPFRIATAMFAGGLLFGLTACGGGEKEVPFPTVAPFPPELEQKIHEIRDRVSAIRGLPPYEELIEGIVTPEALQQYSAAQIQELSEEEKADLDAADSVLTTLGLIGPEVDLAQVFSDEYSGLVLGLYEIEENRLVLVGGPDMQLTMENELTLAHEYAHSFQDAQVGPRQATEGLPRELPGRRWLFPVHQRP